MKQIKHEKTLSASKSLLDLTNKFLKEFFELAHTESIKEKKESKRPESVSDKRNDSYNFNYTLAECIANSEHIKNHHNTDYVLIGSGFASNIVKELFNNNIKGVGKDILYLIKNIKNQDDGLDYFINDLKTNTKTITTDIINDEYFSDRKKPLFIKGEVVEKTQDFTIVNNKSGYKGVCKVIFKDNELEKILVYGKSSNTDLQLDINARDEGKIQHLRT